MMLDSEREAAAAIEIVVIKTVREKIKILAVGKISDLVAAVV